MVDDLVAVAATVLLEGSAGEGFVGGCRAAVVAAAKDEVGEDENEDGGGDEEGGGDGEGG